MEYVRLKDIGRIITGNTPPTSKAEYYGDYMPFIKATDILFGTKCTLVTEQSYSKLAAEKYKESLVPKGSTCVVTIGSIGKKMTYAHTDLFVNQAINAIVPKNSYDKEYIFYNVRYSVLPQLKKLDSGTTSGRENVSKSSFSSIRIPVIKDKSVQHRIASILSTYDTLMENNTKRIRLLEKMAENLYKEWFVRFRFPGHENVEMENGLPKGWKIERVKKCVERLGFGRTYKEHELTNDGKVIVIDQSTKECLGYHNGEPAHKASVDKPILLFGDHSCKFKLMIEDFSLGENVVPFISADCSLIDVYYLFYATHKLISTEEYKRHWGKFVAMKILIPNMNLQKMFSERIKQMKLYKENLAKQNTLLARQRDLLLPRLMSGKLEV